MPGHPKETTPNTIKLSTPPLNSYERFDVLVRTRSLPRLADHSPRPVDLKSLAERLPHSKVTWRRGQRGELASRFSWTRIWPAQSWARGECADAESLWLLLGGCTYGEVRYAFSNLSAKTTSIRAVRIWKGRWPVEQGYQQMKEELGLNHFKRRPWHEFYHHIYLVMLAYGFLVLEQLREKEVPTLPGKKVMNRRGSQCLHSGERKVS